MPGKRRVRVEKRVNAYATISRNATVERLTAHYVVLSVDGEPAYFERSTGCGLRGALGNPRLQGQRAGDWRGWRLRWADWDRVWVDDYHIGHRQGG